jgi:hypothetical protein
LIFECFPHEKYAAFIKNPPDSRFFFISVENGKEIGQDFLGKRLGLNGKERFQGKKSTWVPIRLLSARANDT